MAPNLPPSITVSKNLASTIRKYIQQQGGKKVSEADMVKILGRVAQVDAKRDSGEVQGGSIFAGGSKYIGNPSQNFVVQNGQQIQLSNDEYNQIFDGYLEKLEDTKVEAKVKEDLPIGDDSSDLSDVANSNKEKAILANDESSEVAGNLIANYDLLREDGSIDFDEYNRVNIANDTSLKNKTQAADAVVKNRAEFMAMDGDGNEYLSKEELAGLVQETINNYGEISDETLNAQILKRQIEHTEELSAIIQKVNAGETLTPQEQVKLGAYGMLRNMENEVEIEKQIRQKLEVSDEHEIPANITGKYVTIGGENVLVIQKDGITMDEAEFKKFAKEFKAGTTARNFANDFKSDGEAEIGNAKKLAKSQMAQINLYGDGKGKVTFEEFVRYQADEAGDMSLAENSQFREQVKATFDFYDKNGNGISRKELRKGILAQDFDKNGKLEVKDMFKYNLSKETSISDNMKQHIFEAVDKGFILQVGNEMPFYVDSNNKMFIMNEDGSVGDEIQISQDE